MRFDWDPNATVSQIFPRALKNKHSIWDKKKYTWIDVSLTSRLSDEFNFFHSFAEWKTDRKGSLQINTSNWVIPFNSQKIIPQTIPPRFYFSTSFPTAGADLDIARRHLHNFQGRFHSQSENNLLKLSKGGSRDVDSCWNFIFFKRLNSLKKVRKKLRIPDYCWLFF